MGIRKLLIANRGEIACRIIATARKLGITTVAVYSDVDRAAKHVKMADESAYIGPSPAKDSYLNIERVMETVRATGADAVHPGYGFLSENAAFVEALTADGITFVGPPASAIQAMGLKDAAKIAMEKAGVPVVPGYHGTEQDAAHLAQMAADIGYPVMIKARSGGGGKGMRRVDHADDFMQALSGAQREGQASFGDPSVLIEKFIEHPRHIEVQVFADTHGNYVHLHERDCSLQRRHQKVIEEAPAPGMTPELRATLGEIALRAARAVEYVGAGTVEFIVDGSGPLRAEGCWFMEMNTRLQVEHPVTEAITGIDLVEWQLLVAAGHPLPLAQAEIPLRGHAMEARLYAEDVPAGFLPATGKLTQVAFPEGASAFEPGDVRVDSGVVAGDEISAWYDPMIAKLITHASTRDIARARLTRALGDTELVGPNTNIAFLHKLSTLPEFRDGQMHTGSIAQNLESLAAPQTPETKVIVVAALAILDLVGSKPLRGWRAWGTAKYTCTLTCADQLYEVGIAEGGMDGFLCDESRYIVKNDERGRVRVSCDGAPATWLSVIKSDNEVTVFQNGETFTFSHTEAGIASEVSGEGEHLVRAPMPGIVKAVTCTAGDVVTKGQALLVMEAMKMEHTLTAPRDGTLADVPFGEGAQVSSGAVLVEFTQDQDD